MQHVVHRWQYSTQPYEHHVAGLLLPRESNGAPTEKGGRKEAAKKVSFLSLGVILNPETRRLSWYVGNLKP